MRSLAPRLLLRLSRSLRRWPDRHGWRDTLIGTLVFATVALPLGFAGDLFQLTASGPPPGQVFTLAVVFFFAPGVLEELLFRVLPVPSEGEAPRRTRLLWAAAALVGFILYHPLNARFFRPQDRPTFYDPTFLTIAALLGFVCAVLYWRTRSAWPAILLHYLAVFVWHVLLGGWLLY